MSDIEETALIALTAEIVSAYVTKNRLPPTGLPELIASVSGSIRKLGEPAVEWVFPVYDVRKEDLARELPAELVEMTWSCRRPLDTPGGYRPCGACTACSAASSCPKWRACRRARTPAAPPPSTTPDCQCGSGAN